MKYTSLTIQNFRGIRLLKIDNLKQVNLFVGRNNSGKTSILEAMFLISGMSNPQLPASIHAFRDLDLVDDEDFSYLFTDRDFTRIPEIEAAVHSDKEKKRRLKIEPLYARPTTALEKKSNRNSNFQLALSNATDPVIAGLRLSFRNNLHKTFRQVEIRLKESQLKFAKNYKEPLVCAFLNEKAILAGLDTRLDTLIAQKNLEKVVAVLHEIEPRITDVRLGAHSMVYVDIGDNFRLPIQLMGDGIKHFLAILAAISATKDGVLLIDEIENGFHYSWLSTLWKAIFRAAQEFNVQIMATTHSYECVQAFGSNDYDDICLYRLDRKGDQHKAFESTADVLRTGLEMNFEVR